MGLSQGSAKIFGSNHDVTESRGNPVYRTTGLPGTECGAVATLTGRGSAVSGGHWRSAHLSWLAWRSCRMGGLAPRMRKRW